MADLGVEFIKQPYAKEILSSPISQCSSRFEGELREASYLNAYASRTGG